MAKKKKRNAMAKYAISRTGKISADVAKKLVNDLPYFHYHYENFEKSLEVLEIDDLEIDNEVITTLKEISNKFKTDYDTFITNFEIEGSTDKERIENIKRKIFTDEIIELWNQSIPEKISSQANDFFNNVNWVEAFEEMTDSLLNNKKRTLLAGTKKGKTGTGGGPTKWTYGDILLNASMGNFHIDIFPAQRKKDFMQRFIDVLYEKMGSKITIPKKDLQKIFYGEKNSIEGILTLSALYNRFIFKRSTLLNERELQDLEERIKYNISHNSQLLKQLKGMISEEMIEEGIKKAWGDGTTTVSIYGAQKSGIEGLSDSTTKIDILINSKLGSFGISSKNLIDTGEKDNWLIGTFHQASSTGDLFDFLKAMNFNFKSDDIELEKLLIYLISNLYNDNREGNQDVDVRRYISNIAKLYLSAFIGWDLIENEKENSKKEQVNNIFIISAPHQIIIPTFLVLEAVINKIENNLKMSNLNYDPETDFFDTKVFFSDDDKIDPDQNLENLSLWEEGVAELRKEKPDDSNLMYNNEKLREAGGNLARQAKKGKKVSVQLNFVRDKLLNLV